MENPVSDAGPVRGGGGTLSSIYKYSASCREASQVLQFTASRPCEESTRFCAYLVDRALDRVELLSAASLRAGWSGPSPGSVDTFW